MQKNTADRLSWRMLPWGMTKAFAHAALGVLVVACGQGGGGGAGGSSGGVELDVEHCAGFTAAAAAGFLGIDAASIEDSSQPLGEDEMWCIFSNTDDSSQSVNFTVGRAASTEAAEEDFAQFVGHAGVATEVLGEEGDSAHLVPDLGDEAIWSPTPGILVVRVGRYSLQVNNPSDEDVQIQIARRILERS